MLWLYRKEIPCFFSRNDTVSSKGGKPVKRAISLAPVIERYAEYAAGFIKRSFD